MKTTEVGYFDRTATKGPLAFIQDSLVWRYPLGPQCTVTVKVQDLEGYAGRSVQLGLECGFQSVASSILKIPCFHS